MTPSERLRALREKNLKREDGTPVKVAAPGLRPKDED